MPMGGGGEILVVTGGEIVWRGESRVGARVEVVS